MIVFLNEISLKLLYPFKGHHIIKNKILTVQAATSTVLLQNAYDRSCGLTGTFKLTVTFFL